MGIKKRSFARPLFDVAGARLELTTFGFAVKATFTEVDGDRFAIFKDPKTDSKKKSAKGLLFVSEREDGELYLIDEVSDHVERSENNALQTIFKDGVWIKRTSLNEIREKLGTL